MGSSRNFDRPVAWRRRLPLIALAPLTALVQWLASFAPQAVETVYSRAIYPLVARTAYLVTGWLPFSVAELLVVAGCAWIAWRLVRAWTQWRRGRRRLPNLLLHGFVDLLAVAGVAYFLGVSLWGLNHQRQPLAVAAGLDVSAASVEELRGLCLDLVDEVNGLRDHVKEDANGVMRLAASPADALRRARLGYEGIETEYALLDGGLAGRPKGLMLSAVMSWIGPSGVYSPFTAEPNVNMELPHTEIPTTVCHEMAHRLGFAREDEANFIGYLAARRHPDVDFRYGGALEALSYALRALASADSESVSEILGSCSEGVRRDWDAERAFYRRHRSPVSKVTHRINDAYLKSQGQAAGARSYGRMVDLLIADRRRRASNRD